MKALFLLLRFLSGVGAGAVACATIFAYLFGDITFLGLALLHLPITVSSYYLSNRLKELLDDC